MLRRRQSCVEVRMAMCCGEDGHVLRRGWSCVKEGMVLC